MGLGNYDEVKSAIVLIGYDPDRTPHMIDEIITSSDISNDIVLMTRKELDHVDPRYRYIRATSLTSASDLTRAGVPNAAKVVIFSWSDEETLAAALAVTARFVITSPSALPRQVQRSCFGGQTHDRLHSRIVCFTMRSSPE